MTLELSSIQKNVLQKKCYLKKNSQLLFQLMKSKSNLLSDSYEISKRFQGFHSRFFQRCEEFSVNTFWRSLRHLHIYRDLGGSLLFESLQYFSNTVGRILLVPPKCEIIFGALSNCSFFSIAITILDLSLFQPLRQRQLSLFLDHRDYSKKKSIKSVKKLKLERAITIREAIQKRSHESIYKTNTKN